jgi:hypothetical protein
MAPFVLFHGIQQNFNYKTWHSKLWLPGGNYSARNEILKWVSQCEGRRTCAHTSEEASWQYPSVRLYLGKERMFFFLFIPCFTQVELTNKNTYYLRFTRGHLTYRYTVTWSPHSSWLIEWSPHIVTSQGGAVRKLKTYSLSKLQVYYTFLWTSHHALQ